MSAADPDRPTGPALPAKVVDALARLARGQRAHRQAVATQHNLTPLQLELLVTLGQAPPPEPLVGALARELAVTQPTAQLYAARAAPQCERSACSWEAFGSRANRYACTTKPGCAWNSRRTTRGDYERLENL